MFFIKVILPKMELFLITDSKIGYIRQKRPNNEGYRLLSIQLLRQL
jgi:hypothetical protein